VGLDRIQAFLSAFQVAAIRSAMPVIDDDGWRTVDVPVESIDHALWDVLKMAPHMEVLSPAELRQRVAETACHLAGLHR